MGRYTLQRLCYPVNHFSNSVRLVHSDHLLDFHKKRTFIWHKALLIDVRSENLKSEQNKMKTKTFS